MGRRRLAELIVAVLVVATVVALFVQERRLYPRDAWQWALFAAGVVLPVVLLLAASRVRRGAGSTLAILAGSAMVAGLVLGLGWTRFGSVDTTTEPRGVQAFGAGATVATALFLAAILALLVSARRRAG
jgi:cytochrome bd-type quinol oxidase subunit 2